MFENVGQKSMGIDVSAKHQVEYMKTPILKQM